MRTFLVVAQMVKQLIFSYYIRTFICVFVLLCRRTYFCSCVCRKKVVPLHRF